MKRYYNKELNKWYYEGTSLTHHTEKTLFSGIPTEEQLKNWGYELQAEPAPRAVDPIEQRKAEILSELASMDYLTDKELDGEDMAKYNEKYGGDWHEYRRKLREEYRKLNPDTPNNTDKA